MNTTTIEDIADKKEKPAHINKSIHRRVVSGRAIYPKVNTSKTRDPNKIKKVISAIEDHLIYHPNDAMSQKRLTNLKKIV